MHKLRHIDWGNVAWSFQLTKFVQGTMSLTHEERLGGLAAK